MKKTLIATVTAAAMLLAPVATAQAAPSTGGSGLGHSGKGQPHSDPANLPGPDLVKLQKQVKATLDHILGRH